MLTICKFSSKFSFNYYYYIWKLLRKEYWSGINIIMYLGGYLFIIHGSLTPSQRKAMETQLVAPESQHIPEGILSMSWRNDCWKSWIPRPCWLFPQSPPSCPRTEASMSIQEFRVLESGGPCPMLHPVDLYNCAFCRAVSEKPASGFFEFCELMKQTKGNQGGLIEPRVEWGKSQ